jgi:hypothetical protein
VQLGELYCSVVVQYSRVMCSEVQCIEVLCSVV